MMLHVMIDYSGSMEGQVAGSGMSKLDSVKEMCVQFLDSLPAVISRIKVSRFADMVEEMGTCQTTREAKSLIDGDDGHPQGGTRLWDCLYGAIEGAPDNEQTLVICFTDGDDQESTYTLNDLERLVKDKRNVEVRVFDLRGNISSQPTGVGSVRVSHSTVQNLQSVLPQVVHDTLTWRVPGRRPMTTTVVPLTEIPDGIVPAIHESLERIHPFLEDLCRLRYYPVPTYIVNEFTLKTVGYEASEGEANDRPSDYESLVEMLRFLDALALTFSGNCFLPKPDTDDHYDLRSIAESISADILHFIDGKEDIPIIAGTSLNNHFPGKAFLEQAESAWKLILSAIQNIVRKNTQIIAEDEYFSGTSFGRPYFWKNRDYPSIPMWEPYLSGNDLEKLAGCIFQDGVWDKSVASLLVAAQLTVPIVFKLAREQRRVRSTYLPIIKKIHTFGVYIPHGSPADMRLNNLLTDQGFPRWFRPSRGGKVLICLERIEKSVAETVEETDPGAYEELIRKMFTAVLVHEHAHAITEEGIDGDGGNRFPQTEDQVKVRIIKEALAEWAELEFFRKDTRMKVIILEHITMGRLPDWPYHAALFLEKDYPLIGNEKFRAVLGYARQNMEKAYDMLNTDWEERLEEPCHIM